jgi:hypothetical protein
LVENINPPDAWRHVASRPTVFFNRSGSSMWSPTVAKHDETRNRRRVAAGPFSSVLHGLDATLQGLVGEELVENHVVEEATAQLESVRTERNDRERNVLVEGRVEPQNRIAANRSVVPDDGLALP